VPKKTYRSQDVKIVNIEQLQQQHAVERLVVGVDVAKHKFVAAFVGNTSGNVALTIRWTHPAETPQFIALLKSLGAQTVQVALESTGRYGDVLVHQLRVAQIAVYNISTKRVHDAAEEYDGVPSKHDGKDAAVIGDLHRRGKSRVRREPSEATRALQAYTRSVLLFKNQYLTNINRIEAELARFWPELTEHISLQTASLLTLLATYGTPAEVAADMEQARILLRKISRGSLSEQTVDNIVQTARQTQGASTVAAETDMMCILAQDTLRACEALKEAERRLEAAVQQHPSAARQAAMLGVVTAAVVVAKSGDAADFTSTGAWLKNLGLNLKENSSGKSGQRGVAITKRGAAITRQYLYLAALRFIQHDEVIKSWYAYQTNRPGAVKMKVLVKLMRKLASALPHVGRGAVFDARKLFDTTRFPMLESAKQEAA
jgi:transposase